MKKSKGIASASAVLLFVFLAPEALAQRSSSVNYSRPSQQSASSTINRIGGAYTGDSTLNVIRLRNQNSFSNPFSMSARSASMRGLSPAAGSLGMDLTYGQGFSEASSVSMPMIGSGSSTLFRNRTIDTGVVSPEALVWSSGFSSATELATPIGGWHFVPPTDDTPIYPVRAQRTAFQEFFGLQPPEKQSGMQPGDTVTRVVEANNQASAESLMKKAKASIKDKKFLEAMALLSAIKRADPNVALPSVLIAHAALEQNESWLALTSLIEAIRRDPNVFVNGLDIKSFYPDLESFERPLRVYTRSSMDGDTAVAQILRCYCAWQLGDALTARAAFDKMNSPALRQTVADLQALDAFCYSIAPALK